MQIIIQVCFVCTCFVIFQTAQCGRTSISSERPPEPEKITNAQESESSEKQQFPFKLLTKDCFEEPTCLAFIYMKKDLFTNQHLLNLTHVLNQKNPKKIRLRVFFFDNLRLGQAYLKGHKEFRDLENDARALFYSSDSEEYLKVRTTNKKSENWSSWQTVFSNLRN
jgi:hypothetical protein